MRTRSEPLFQVVRGFCMGAADVVPGVSGGTIALVFGIYSRLVHQVSSGAHALGHLVQGRRQQFVDDMRSIDWAFLLPLLAGIGLAVVSLASVISHFLEEEPIRTAAVFFGLVIGSLVTTLGLVRDWSGRNALILVGAGATTFVALGLGDGQITDPALPYVFLGGSIAICAMILPGVSGSFLLLMLGLYHAVLDAVHERDLTVIAVFGVGAILGLALFSSLLAWALDKHEQPMLAGLLGLMVGSLRVLWPWPNGTGSEESTNGAEMALPAGDVLVPILLAVAAAAAIVLVQRLAGVTEDAEPAHVPS